MKYDHKAIDSKWQARWMKDRVFAAHDDFRREKFYCLVEFPYPSGAGLHMGHPRSYTAMDVLARKRRMQGFNVLYPMGWDAFGLPTENYAIKTGRKPQDVTAENIETFRRQLQSLGLSFDWDREVNTTDPDYYKWTQWMFLEFFKEGLAYKKAMAINWCLSCKIGLANEEVVDGACERCGGEIEKRNKEQWMIAITKYADRLLEDLETVDYLPKIKKQQQDWIGRSEGVAFRCKVKDVGLEFDVFDSVPQTFMAQTFSVIAPDHPHLEEIVRGTKDEKKVLKKAAQLVKARMSDKYNEEKEVDGIFTGRYIEDPYGTGDLPLWVASFAIADYGSGVVNCSAHDERDFAFAKKFDIPLRPVMFPEDPEEAQKVRDLEYCYHHDPEGVLEAPETFAGRKWGEVRDDVISFIEKKKMGTRSVNYKLRDWVFSRQRYWGEPIPLVKCAGECGKDHDGWVAVPEDQLPVVLPDVEKYEPTDDGESPLAAIDDFVNTTCPECGGPATRETDTMPNWAGSSWYFLRYIDPKNDGVFADKKKLKQWMPIDWYNGGMEHTTLHLLYSRFWNKVLYDRGHVPVSEPYAKRTSHGMILAEDGSKMSKSRGNVVNPDELVSQFGADALRLLELFIGPFGEAAPYSHNGMVGMRRFLDRVHGFADTAKWQQNEDVHRASHKLVKEVSEHIESMKFNTAVAKLMEWFNLAQDKGATKDEFGIFLKLLSPFAPHVAEELWARFGNSDLICQQPWPSFDAELAKDDVVTIGVQVNGKVRGDVEIAVDATEEEARELALADEKIAKYIDGKEIKKFVYVPGRIISFVV